MAENINIGGRLHSTATGNIVTGANEVYDDDKGKKQSDINTETYSLVNDVNERLSGLSPDQQSALGVAAKATNNETKLGYYVCNTEDNIAAKVISDATGYILSMGGSIKIKMINANTAADATLNINSTGARPLYYDGERASYNNTWEAGEIVDIYYNGENYYANNVAGGGKFLSGEKVKEVGIDDNIINGSNNLVKSGTIYNEFALAGVYDVSAKNPTGGPNSDGKFTLNYILNPNNVNTLIPTAVRKGGMNIKFVQSSDNKYAQYRLMSNTFSTIESDWQGVNDELKSVNKNLIESGAIANILGYINCVYSGANNAFPVNIKAKDTVIFSITNRTSAQSVVLSKTSSWDTSTNLIVISSGTGNATVEYGIPEDYGYVWISGDNVNSTLTIRSKYTIKEIQDALTEKIGIDFSASSLNSALFVGIKKGYNLRFSISNRNGNSVVLSKTNTWDENTNLTVISYNDSGTTVEKNITLNDDYGYVWISGGSGTPILTIRNAENLYESQINGDKANKEYTNEQIALLDKQINGESTETPAPDYSYTTGYAINYSNGTRFWVNNSVGATDYIEIDNADAIKMLAFVSSNQSTSAGYAFYDKNKIYVSGGRFLGDVSEAKEKILLNPQNKAVYIRYTVLVAAGQGYCNLITFDPKPLRNLFSDILPQIKSEDIYFNLGQSIFIYPTHSATDNTTIDSEGNIVSQSNYLLTEIISNSNLGGLWKLYYNDEGASAFDYFNYGFKIALYSGSTFVKLLSVTSNGNNPICISKDYIEENNIDGFRLSCASNLSWNKIVLTRVCKYDVYNTFKSDYLRNYGINLAFFPREEGESDDTNRIKRALSLAMWGGTVTIPSGEYIVSSPIEVYYLQHIHFEQGAIIKASPSFSGDYVLKWNGGGQYGRNSERYWTTNRWWLIDIDGNIASWQMSMDGGTIDAMGKAGCLSMTGFKNFQLADMQLRNPKTIGLYTYGTLMSYELMASKIHVINTIGGNSGNIGVKASNTDNHYCDVVVVDCTIGMQMSSSSNRLTRCHHWCGPANNGEYIANSISFDLQNHDNVLTDCYADTSETNYKIGSEANGCRLFGCGSFSNTYFTIMTCTHIYNDGEKLAVIGCNINAGVSTGGTVTKVAGNKSIWQSIANNGID